MIACRGEYSVDRIVCCMGEVIAAHSAVLLHVCDDRLHGGAPSHDLFDGGGYAAFLGMIPNPFACFVFGVIRDLTNAGAGCDPG